MNARLLLLCLALCPVSALAGDAIRVSLRPRAALGEGHPALEVHILEPLVGFEVKLRRGDGHEVVVRGGGPPGVTRQVVLEQPEGRFHYEGELTVRFTDAEPASMPLSFDAEVLGPLRLTVAREDVDVEARRLRFRLSRPASRARLTVLMDTGRKAFEGEVAFQGQPAGAPLEVTWPQVEGRVLSLSLRAYDTSEFYTGVELFPWQVDIPHEEVNFARGSAEVPASEKGKLAHSQRLILEAVKKYGRFASLRLYVVGHTDSVGEAGANRELSLRRARAIAAFLRKGGVRLPLFYEGFGEQSLRVGTADEVDEPANRRAEYILAVEDPVLPGAPFAPKWNKL